VKKDVMALKGCFLTCVGGFVSKENFFERYLSRSEQVLVHTNVSVCMILKHSKLFNTCSKSEYYHFMVGEPVRSKVQ